MQKERITNVELVSSQQSAVSSPLTRRRFLKGGGAICIGAIALQGLGNFAHAHETGGSTWTIKLTAINPGDGQNTGDDKKAFNWKKITGTMGPGNSTSYLLCVRWRLEAANLKDKIGKKRDSWTYKLRFLAQFRVAPIADPRPGNALPEGSEEYMLASGQFYGGLALEAQGDMEVTISGHPTKMECVLQTILPVKEQQEMLGNQLNSGGDKYITNGSSNTKYVLALGVTHSPIANTSGPTLTVSSSFKAAIIQTSPTSTANLNAGWTAPAGVTFGASASTGTAVTITEIGAVEGNVQLAFAVCEGAPDDVIFV